MFALLNLTLGFLFVSRQVDLRPRTVRRDADVSSRVHDLIKGNHRRSVLGAGKGSGPGKPLT